MATWAFRSCPNAFTLLFIRGTKWNLIFNPAVRLNSNATMRQVEGTLISMYRNPQNRKSPPVSSRIWTLMVLLVLAILVRAQSASSQFAPAASEKDTASPRLVLDARANVAHDRSATPRVATGQLDSLGRSITISCASCHANFEPNTAIGSGERLEQFHQGLTFSHGKLTCLSCHHSKNFNWLRLAGEQPLEFSQSQNLCGQCHSKQHNDYEHGAHGGMNGHWNLARGERTRKRCIDCHDPHSPAFPAMVPTFRPRDRFLEQSQEKHAGSVHE